MICASSCFLPLSVAIQEKNGQNIPESDPLIKQEDAREGLQQNKVETDHD